MIDSNEPKVFISYSSDRRIDEWVRMLAERLEGNGIHVKLDQWDVFLGADLAKFMEKGLTGADRVLCVCSDAYIDKANDGHRGVGYEKKILSASMLKNADSNHVIPILRDVRKDPPVPTFLYGSKYCDFRNDDQFEEKYRELIFDLYGKTIYPRPPHGDNPFDEKSSILTELAIRYDKTKFESLASDEIVTFNYTDNDGFYSFGTSPDLFQLHVTESGIGSIYVYKDSSNIVSIGLAMNTSIEGLLSPELYDGSSRVRKARVGDTVVLINDRGRVAAMQILQVSTRDSSEDGIPRMIFRYKILTPSINAKS